jgi:transcriptional regulator with XRE-family HTH domain
MAAAHELLAARIEARGLTHADIARELGVTRQAVGGWVKGEKPSRGNVTLLDNLLDANGAVLDAYGYPSTIRRKVTIEDAIVDDDELGNQAKSTLLAVVEAFRSDVKRRAKAG